MTKKNGINRRIVGGCHRAKFADLRGSETIRPLVPQLRGGAGEHRAGALFVCTGRDERQ